MGDAVRWRFVTNGVGNETAAWWRPFPGQTTE
ncbi:MAG: hypothetical protein ACKO8O_15515 [Betaproteobacteria bacterium]